MPATFCQIKGLWLELNSLSCGGWGRGPGGCGTVVGLRGMNGHLVRAHRSETHWTSRPASLYTENLKKSLWGGFAICGGGGGDGWDGSSFFRIFPHVFLRLAEGCTLIHNKERDRWVVDRISKAFEKAGNTNCCLDRTQSSRGGTQCTQATRVGLCNCAPTCTWAAHSLAQSAPGRRGQKTAPPTS